MPDRNAARKRRPVDVLFGDRSSAYTDYVIEAPQPVTTVSPPPPALILLTTPATESMPPRVEAPREQASINPAPVAALPKLPEIPSASTPEPIPGSKKTATQDRISQMYDVVREQLGTGGVARECMELLLQARIADGEGDSATAEYYTETVEARLAQSALSQQSARRPIVWIIWLWNVVVLVGAGTALFGSYVFSTSTLFGIVDITFIILLMRTMAFGIIGSVLGVMLGLVRAIRHRVYDPAENFAYFAKPVIGAILGGLISILLQMIAVFGGGMADLVVTIRVFMYLLALLVGFGLDALSEFFSSGRD